MQILQNTSITDMHIKRRCLVGWKSCTLTAAHPGSKRHWLRQHCVDYMTLKGLQTNETQCHHNQHASPRHCTQAGPKTNTLSPTSPSPTVGISQILVVRCSARVSVQILKNTSITEMHIKRRCLVEWKSCTLTAAHPGSKRHWLRPNIVLTT